MYSLRRRNLDGQMIWINTTSNSYYPNDMKSVLDHISEKYKGIYMSPEVIKEIADEIRSGIRFIHPFIEDYIRIENDDIHIAMVFAENSKGCILFLPLIFKDLRYNHPYDIYVADICLGGIEFRYAQDHHSICTYIDTIPKIVMRVNLMKMIFI